MTKHTPIYTVTAGRCIERDGKPFVTLHRCTNEKSGNGYFTPVECDEFTHLAASAPQMLEALEAIIGSGVLLDKRWSGLGKIESIAKAAIKAAKGE